jgi:hypothetical protein
MSDLLDITHKELLRIAQCAETTMQADDTALLNTNLELDLFDDLLKEICGRIDTYEEQRVQIVKEENTLQQELQKLVEEERSQIEPGGDLLIQTTPSKATQSNTPLTLTNAAVHL